MTKWILALCVGLSAVGGCVLDTDEAPESIEGVNETELAATGITYIDYGALRGNRAPCPANQVKDIRTQRCVPRPPSIYQRGCTAQTRCARG